MSSFARSLISILRDIKRGNWGNGGGAVLTNGLPALSLCGRIVA